MNKNVLSQGKKIVAVVFLMTAAGMHAQAPVPPEGPNPGMEKPKPEMLKEIRTVSGTVSRMSANDDFVYDGFYLDGSGGPVLVKFPPHLGSQITALARQGGQISVKGFEEVAPDGNNTFRMKSVTANGKTVEDTPPAVPQAPPQETSATGSGAVTELQKNREGHTVGIFVDGTLLKVPPHVFEKLGTSLVKGAKISFTGAKKPENSGEVAERKFNIVRARTISIDGKEYSL